MLALRNTLKASAVFRSTSAVTPRFMSKQVAAKPADAEEDAVSPVQIKREELSKKGKYVVWGKSDDEALPAPVLPENKAEIAKLDPMDQGHRHMMDGKQRTVVIRQEKASMRQSPLQPENLWRIFFYEDGMIAEKWTNSLMGWTSNADPYQCGPPVTFENAADAVYFAQKRGWKYVVKQPILRYMRRDDAQYQDNFLPQATAAKVSKEGVNCQEWERKAAATSHYFRPLTYHGEKEVRQHGPNGDAKIAPHVDGLYKIR